MEHKAQGVTGGTDGERWDGGSQSSSSSSSSLFLFSPLTGEESSSADDKILMFLTKIYVSMNEVK